MIFRGKRYVSRMDAIFWAMGFINGLLLGTIAGLLIEALIQGITK